MGSKYPIGFYDEEKIAALEHTFREVWKTIIMSDPFRDTGRDAMLRQTVVQTMMKHAVDGFVDVSELRDKTIAAIVAHGRRRSPSVRPQRRRRQAA